MFTKEKQQNIINNYGNIPISFVRNAGQMDSRIHYYSQGAGQGFYFTPVEAVFTFTETSPDHF